MELDAKKREEEKAIKAKVTSAVIARCGEIYGPGCLSCFREWMRIVYGSISWQRALKQFGINELVRVIEAYRPGVKVHLDLKAKHAESARQQQQAREERDLWQDILIKRYEAYRRQLLLIGIDPDIEITYTGKRCGMWVLDWIPDIDNRDDFFWLCNQVSRMYRKVKNNCVDNTRLCRDFGGPSIDYHNAQGAGCCGRYDALIINKKTGNRFWIGCNYGH